MPAKINAMVQPQLRALSRCDARQPTKTRLRGGRSPGAIRHPGSENATAGIGAAYSNRSMAACSTAVGRRGPRESRPSSARPPLPFGASRRSVGALMDITNIAGEEVMLPQLQDLLLHHGDPSIAAPLRRTEPVVAPFALPLQEIVMEDPFKSMSPKQPRQPQLSFDVTLDEYVPDISERLFRDEQSSLPQPDYMDTQSEITTNMRAVLVDWLVEVHMKHHLCLETLHLTVNIVDRYLAKATVGRRRLQLVGVVAMFIASKFEEIHAPELDFWVYITASAYTPEDVILMECAMLTTLNFQIMVPTAAHFLPLLQKANGSDDVHGALVEYIVELGLLDTRMLCYPPSHVVSAALLLSNELLGRVPVWPATMSQLSRRTAPALRPCAEVMRELLELDRAGLEGQPRTVHRKFSSSQHHSVATMAL